MPIILFDTPQRDLLYPFTGIRAIADIRAGILTVKERWEKLTGQKVYVLTAPYLQAAYSYPPAGEKILVNAAVIPDENLVSLIMNLQVQEAIVKDGAVIAAVSPDDQDWNIHTIVPEKFENRIPYDPALKKIVHPWHIFQWNNDLIRGDFALITANRLHQSAANIYGWTAPEHIFIEDGVVISHCFINASEGPVYLGKHAVIMEGCMIRGPFAMGEGSVLKMGTKIYGATTLGPYCTAGGEIKNSVMMGYSSKAHDGYLGDSVIGEWCNLGAGTSNSNVRNDAAVVYSNKGQTNSIAVGFKCGLLMGDYSRSAINTSFNTGTFAGIAANIFGQGFAPKHLPDFTWGFTQRYIFDKAITHIANWKKLKQHDLTSGDIQILEHLYKQTIP
ncbi:putative sugar nucleotidyl transferase [Agriterribacter sp.]|uniref:putative sugar nucleotidyl transferase n=1 Tax=Agriterribacter sp. TaxID=2821509 RepID=UPI002C5E6B4F|nr:putative sugar nucleotidyl transferase [Agriterribacter sp.]HTN06236.1 putative sugar nucleotidyl transferase [Agriterribacter sp.]